MYTWLSSCPADHMSECNYADLSQSRTLVMPYRSRQIVTRLVPCLQSQESGIRFAIVLWGELSDKCRTLLDCPVLTFADVLAKGHRASASFSPQPLSADQLATIVYTSGTTGNPKVCPSPVGGCLASNPACPYLRNAGLPAILQLVMGVTFSHASIEALCGRRLILTPCRAIYCDSTACEVTTGAVQGVMLSHANLRYQMDNLQFFLAPRAGDRSLSLLPPWHIYERSCGYFLYSRACTQVTCIPFCEALKPVHFLLRAGVRWDAPCTCC